MSVCLDLISLSESEVTYGLTAALYGRINIEGGRTVPSNFDDYQMVRMREVPEIELFLVPSGDVPGGIGEFGSYPWLSPSLPASRDSPSAES